MDLKTILRQNQFDFQPNGATEFLANFSPTVADSRRRVDALVAKPRDIITHAFKLDDTQLGLLARTSDDALKADLQPVFDALLDGKTVKVLSILTLAEGAKVEEPVIRDQQQTQQTQIVITIGRGRCKITITIDL